MTRLAVDLRLRRGDFLLQCAHEFPPGVTAIVGSSGAGKSTLLDAICGDLKAGGSIRLGDEIVAHDRVQTAPHRRAFRRVYQEARLFPHLDVAANLAFARGRVPGVPEEELLEELELSGLLHRDVHGLSGGERQRVALARVLLSTPIRTLLLDEPLSAIDRPHRRRILLAIRRWQRKLAIPLLYVSHSEEEALLIAEHCLRLDQGQIADHGSPARVLGDAGGEEDRVLLLTTVESHSPASGLSELRWGERLIEAPLCPPSAGEEVVVDLPARDVVVCTERPRATSARNCVPAILEDLQARGGSLHLARFRVEGAPADGPALLGHLTPSAILELGLTPGRACWLLFKSSALRIL